MNKKKNYKQFGGECELDTHHYKCDEDDSNCINNMDNLDSFTKKQHLRKLGKTMHQFLVGNKKIKYFLYYL